MTPFELIQEVKVWAIGWKDTPFMKNKSALHFLIAGLAAGYDKSEKYFIVLSMVLYLRNRTSTTANES